MRWTEGLNDRQAEAVRHLDGPLVVVAGPGSGKTRVLTHRVATLVDQGVKPYQVLAVTFTNKAASEMRERLEGMVGKDGIAGMWVMTFHAMCARMLRRNGDAVGVDRNFTIADQSVARRVLKGVLEGAQKGEVDADVVKIAASSISAAKNDLLNPERMARSSSLRYRQWAEVAQRYNDELAAQGMVDFDDLLLHTVRLLGHPEAGQLWRNRFAYMHVDEFQDTNLVQYAITRRLVADHKQLCVVGDLNQSIYAFRGARPELMGKLRDDFPDAHVVKLEQNYRSTEQIVAVSRALVEPLGDELAAKLWTDNGPGEPVEVVSCADDRQEAKVAVERLLDATDLSEHAILFRTNAQTQQLEQELTRHGLPYRLVGATRFYDRAEIRDAVAWLTLAVNPRNVAALRRAASRPKRGLGGKALDQIVTAAAGQEVDPVSVMRAAQDDDTLLPTRVRNAAASFLQAYDQVVAAASDGPAAAVRALLDDAELKTAYRRKDGTQDAESADREENLDQLLAAAMRFESDGGEPTLLAFLEHASLVSSADDDGDGGVWLITAHAAKGREFDHVQVVGVEEDYFPHVRAKDSSKEVDEERRLLFVAASRARQSLRLYWCHRRLVFGRPDDRLPSRFLSDMPDDVERVRLDDGTAAGRGGRRSAVHTGVRRRPQARHARRAPARKAAPTVEFAERMRVRHARFGPGTITAVDGDRVTVVFDGAGPKVMSAAYAPLVADG